MDYTGRCALWVRSVYIMHYGFLCIMSRVCVLFRCECVYYKLV